MISSIHGPSRFHSVKEKACAIDSKVNIKYIPVYSASTTLQPPTNQHHMYQGPVNQHNPHTLVKQYERGRKESENMF